MKKYDFLVAGSGLYGSVIAQMAVESGKTCLVLEKRPHIAGNAYTDEQAGILVHCYGAHIFHTNNEKVWKYVNRFATFNNFINSPVANFKGELYNLPFNMNTFHKMWGTVTPEEARKEIDRQRGGEYSAEPENLEQQAINLVGRDIYERLIKGYTEKQWGRPCDKLPSFIIKRIPVRFTYDNNYFDAKYQGIPSDGYTEMVRKMLKGADVELNTDYLSDREYWNRQAKKIIYTGGIDAYFEYKFGALAYRGLRFETEQLETDNYQGVAVMNYTDAETPFTRIIEHRHFLPERVMPYPKARTIISREYSEDWKIGGDAYYPVNDAENCALYEKYKILAAAEPVTFGGRLGEYKYCDMDAAIASALSKGESLMT